MSIIWLSLGIMEPGIRRFSSTPLLPVHIMGSPRASDIKTVQNRLAIDRRTMKPAFLTAGVQALEAFGVAPNALTFNPGSSPLVHSKKKASGFHVSDLWSQRQQKELLRRLEIEEAQLAKYQRSQLLNYQSHSGPLRKQSALLIFANQLARASILVSGTETKTSTQGESAVVKALVSPRMRKNLPPKQRLTTLENFIKHLEDVIHHPPQDHKRRSLYQSLRIPTPKFSSRPSLF